MSIPWMWLLIGIALGYLLQPTLHKYVSKAK